MKKFGLYLATAFGLSMLAACSGGDSSAPSLRAMSVDQHITPRQKTVAVITALNYERVAQSLYVAYFGRPADPAGLANVESSLLQAGAPTEAADLSVAYSTNPAVRNLINSFATSKESITLYGNSNTEAFLNAVYENLFDRAPAVSGLVFWTDAIQNGGLNQAEAALAILAASASNTSEQGVTDAQTINNKLAWASYFTSQLTTQNAGNDYSGPAIASAIRSQLGTVQASTSAASIEEEVNLAISNLLRTNQPAVTNLFNGVTWSGTQFVAVGAGGKVATSADGITWTSRGSAISDPMTAANLSAVTSQNGRLIAVGTNGGGLICLSGQACSAIVTAEQNVIVSSTDGITWTSSVNSGNNFSFPIGSELSGIVWSGKQFVAVGDTFSSVSILPGIFENLYGNVYTSVDGLNWSPQTNVTSSTGPGNLGFNKLNAIASSGTTYVALGLQGDIYTSQDGITWATQVSPVTTTLRGIAWSGTKFVAVGLNGVIIESADGVTWSNVSAANANPNGLNLYAITWSGLQFVAVGPGTILSSPDGVSWTARSAGTLNALNSIAWSGSQFAAVGFNTIVTSSDGISWTSRPLP